MDKAKELFGKLFDNVKTKWDGFTRPVRIGIGAGFAAVVLAIVVVSIISSQTGYVTLYSGQSAEDRNEVTKVLSEELGITQWRISGNDIEIAAELEDSVRWQLAVKGYPKSGYGFDHYNSRITITSTESDRQELLRQNVVLNLKASLETIPEVRQALINLWAGKEDAYVLQSGETASHASVMLELRPGASLSSTQIEGVYNIILTSYPGFTRDRISVTDGNGIPLLPSDGTTSEQSLVLQERQMSSMLEFKRTFEDLLEDDLIALFSPMYKKVSVNVTANLDFGNTHSESVVYTPSIAEDGTRGGMIDNEKDNIAYGGMTPEGGLVGTAADSDIAPDYPTLIADADAEVFYERVREIQYKINQEISTYDSALFTVKSVTAAIAIDEGAISADELETLQLFAANALGTVVDNVTVFPTVFPLEPGAASDGTVIPVSQNRSTLIFIIVMLGALLIVLFFLAILTASSKKRRMVRSKLVPSGAYGGGIGGSVGMGADFDPNSPFGNISAQKVAETDVEEPFKLQSLLANDTESRETALKAEIKEFTKQNPEIVAQLIRTWMKEVV